MRQRTARGLYDVPDLTTRQGILKNSTDFAPRCPNHDRPSDCGSALRPLPTTTSGELRKLRTLMRPKHSLNRLLTLKASGVHDLMAASQLTLWKECL